jgi:hypothetical protein
MKTIIGTTFVIIALSAVAVVVLRKAGSASCVPVLPVAEGKSMVASLDQRSLNFASTTVDLGGRSAEGGIQTTFSDGGERQVVEQRFYGETGRAYMRFYFNQKRLFAIVKLNLNYAVPISVDRSGTVKTTEESDYYLDNNGRLCALDINGAAAPIDNESQDMIRDYIAGIL